MTEEKTQRTLQQNKALHKWFKLLSDTLNEAGLDIKATLSQKIEHPWTPSLVKELMWRPTMKSYIQKKSTTRMTTKDIDPILDIIIKYLGENHGLDTPNFPSIKTLIEYEQRN